MSITENDRRKAMAAPLVDIAVRAHAEAGKCIAFTRISSFMALCAKDARPDSLTCSTHR